jgi:hypothetical protein
MNKKRTIEKWNILWPVSFSRDNDKKIFIFNHSSSTKYKDYKLITFFKIDMSDNLYYSMIK